MEKTNLTGLTEQELEQFAVESGEKAFRGRQLFSWIYQRRVDNFDDMSNLSKSLRNKLENTAKIGQLDLVEKTSSPGSDSVKYLFQTNDGEFVESVYIAEDNRRTLCISSQVGCALKCAFCATGAMGFKKNLSHGEIVDQVIFVERDLDIELSNIVFMGMGEPFKNYDNVIKAAHLIRHENGLAIGTRRVVISTAGIIPAIYRYADEGHRFKLAISLHSPYNDDRKNLMPISAKYDVDQLMQAVQYYMKKSRRRITFEYVLLAGVNDRKLDADGLYKLLNGLPCKINIIPYNPTIPKFKRPDKEHVDQFSRWLTPIKAPISVRWSKGDDIDAACGQLAGKFVPQTEAENA
jgi:23S rRNA (adenine2503-C2)-methyltransferase